MESEVKKMEKRKPRPFVTTLVVLFVFLFVVLIAALAFPSPILRHIFSRVEAQTNIAITFDRAYFYFADGSLLCVKGLAVKRQDHHSMNFDLQAESVQMPAMFPNDFRSPVLIITGLRGIIERVGNDPDPAASEKTYVSALMLVDTEVEFIDRTLERPFQERIQLNNFALSQTDLPALFAPYVCAGSGQIGAAMFAIVYNNQGSQKQQMEIVAVPFGLLAPYVPILDDIFISGSMNIQIEELAVETHKYLRVKIWLQPDCEIKSANEMLAPALQGALQQLDPSSMPELQDLQRKIERLKTFAESMRSEVDRVARIMDRLSILVPREVREEYEKFKSQYDRAIVGYNEWNIKFATLLQELDQIKVRIVADTFQAFIDSGVPIEVELQEVDGEWQYDAYAVVIGLVERHYHAIIATVYQKRIQEIRDAVDRLLVL